MFQLVSVRMERIGFKHGADFLFFSLFTNKFKRIIKRLKLAGYDDDTISGYFRKQGARVGERCRIRLRSIASEPYLVTIGNHVAIMEGVVLHTHDGGTWVLKEKYSPIDVFGPITIEDNCLIGVNTQILPNVRIGKNSIVGAGSVVITDIPPNSIAMGVPARVIGSMIKYEEKSLAKWNEQKPPDLRIEEGQDYWYIKGNQEKLRKHLTKLFYEKKAGE
jgi:acetyltransferase-like isoleucine patch superfamily enzyme